MPKLWNVEWEEIVTYSAEIVAETEEEALRYFETGGEFYNKPKAWSEISWGPTIELEREEV